MPDIWNNETQPKVERVKLTAKVSLEAYDLIKKLQRKHRSQTGRALSLRKIIDTAIRAYAGKKTQPEADLRRPRFATIGDMLELARKLVEGLNKLGEQRHPLDVRRG